MVGLDGRGLYESVSSLLEARLGFLAVKQASEAGALAGMVRVSLRCLHRRWVLLLSSATPHVTLWDFQLQRRASLRALACVVLAARRGREFFGDEDEVAATVSGCARVDSNQQGLCHDALTLVPIFDRCGVIHVVDAVHVADYLRAIQNEGVFGVRGRVMVEGSSYEATVRPCAYEDMSCVGLRLVFLGLSQGWRLAARDEVFEQTEDLLTLLSVRRLAS